MKRFETTPIYGDFAASPFVLAEFYPHTHPSPQNVISIPISTQLVGIQMSVHI